MPDENFELKRKSIRVEADSGIEAVYSSGDVILEDAVLTDFSTSGLGITTSHDLISDKLKIQFIAPDILAGVHFNAQIRRTQKNEDGSNIIGAEFLFTSPDQHALLLRWLSSYFQKQINPEDIPGGAYAEYRIYLKGLPKNTSVTVRFPKDIEELEKCLLLLQPFEVQYLHLQTKIFMLSYEHEISAIQALITDTALFKLPADRYCGIFLDELRTNHRRLGEISLPKFDENSYLIRHCRASILTKLNLLFSTFLYLITYSNYLAQLTDLIVVVPNYMQEFYRLWLFNEVKSLDPESRINLKDRGDLSLMQLDLELFAKKSAELRPEIAKQLSAFQAVPGSLSSFSNSFTIDQTVLDRWLRKKKTSFTLTEDQKKYFSAFAPDALL